MDWHAVGMAPGLAIAGLIKTLIWFGLAMLAVEAVRLLHDVANTATTRRRQTMTGPIQLTTKAPDVEREVLFTVDGQEFTIPIEVPPYIAVVYLNALREGGTDKAVQVVLDELIGEQGVKRLAKCKGMTMGDLQQIFAVVNKKVAGVMEAAQGN